MRVQKPMFGYGTSFDTFVYLCSTDFELKFNVINCNSKKPFTSFLKSEPHCPKDLVIDELTGDLYQYNFDKEKWKTICNAGLHSRIAAENNYEKNNLLYQKSRKVFRAVDSAYEPYTSSNEETIVRVLKYWIPKETFKEVEDEFVVKNCQRYIMHPIVCLNPNKAFEIMADSEKGAEIIEDKNFFDTEKSSEGKLHIVFNPPYDERLDIHMEEFYKNVFV